MNAANLSADRCTSEHYLLPSSFAQQRWWFLAQLEATGSAWHVRLPLRLRGRLDMAALEQAVDRLVERHETLRTTLECRDGEVLQVVASQRAVPVELVDIGGADEAELRATLGALGSEPFDLAAGPLLRVYLIRLGPADHALLMISDHSISDAWSSGILFRDLAAFYASVTGGEPLSLPDLPIQYADFAAWQRDWLTGDELDRQAAYWRRRLAGAPCLVTLPGDRPRTPLQGHRGDRLSRALPAELSSALGELARAEGVTLFMLLFAAFNLLLGRWSDQRDLVVGTPIAGRRRSELENLVGCFVNTLALRTRLDPGASFRDLLVQVREATLEAFAHQDLPFEKLVEVLNPPRNLAYSPVFQVLFSLQNAPWEAAGFGTVTVAPAEIAAAGTSKFDLAVSAVEFDGQLWLGLEFNTDLYVADTIRRFGAGFETLLTAIVANPGAALDQLPVQAPADRLRVLRDFNPAPVALAGPLDPYQCFELQVGSKPGALAAVCGDTRVSYQELEHRAGVLAARLLHAGARADQPVAILLPRSIDMLVAVLAVLRIGGHYLPLDPRHPPARLAFILDDAGASLLVATPDTARQLPGYRGRVVEPDLDGESVLPTVPPVTDPGGEVPAYLIYTSGSTGKPKGVLVPRRALGNFLASMTREPGLEATDQLLAVTTLAFDIAVLELLLPLTAGATTVIATDDEVRDPDVLLRRLSDPRITVMQATPATWRNLIAAGWTGRPGLRLLSGGEALDGELAGQLLARADALWNLYGPTETTVWSCCCRVADATAPVRIGRPIANTRCYVLDATGEPVPVGMPGTLWIAGHGVALGYHRRPELTAARFRPDPFGEGCMYDTGDRVRWRSDGQLEWLGRSDFQVKLRGFRIELQEIEGALRSLPAVADAAVLLREIAGDPRLVAFVVPEPRTAAEPGTDGSSGSLAALLAGSLASSLAEVLPAYMIPAQFVLLPALPLTPNGKVDRAALACDAPLAPPAPVVAPRNPAEIRVAALFAELLGLPVVAVDADFFALGGHSLLVTRLLARLRDSTGISVPLRQFFVDPTVAGVANALSQEDHSRALAGHLVEPVPAQPSPPGYGEREAPLSLVQQRLWFLEQLRSGSAAYNLAFAWRLAGPVDAIALERALVALAARHEVLRTCFTATDGVPAQRVVNDQPFALARLDVRDVAGRGGVGVVLRELATETLDLATGPLWRVTVLDEAKDAAGTAQSVLVVVLHHLVADGWSLAVFNRELAQFYAAARGASVALPDPLVWQYADFARWQRTAVADGELNRQLDYWRQQLAGLPHWIELPLDRPRPGRLSGRGARLTHQIPGIVHQGARDFARAEGCTLFMVLLAAFDLLLARHAGTEDVVVGTPVAGRSRTELEGLIGFFVNTLVLRTDLAGNPTVRELLHRVRKVTRDAYANAELPFEQLVEVLQPPRNPGRSPLFQVLFNLHSEPREPLCLEGISCAAIPIERRTAKFELAVSLVETASGISATFEYATDLFLAASVERMAADFAALLECMVAFPDRRLSALPFRSTAGGQPDGPAPVIRISEQETLPAVFAGLLREHGDRLAVSAPGEDGKPGTEWTYAELGARAAALARELRQRGVAPGDRVGLWFGHGAGQVAGMLGVLQAGAAFVPLDPAMPARRLASLVADAGLRLVVSEPGAIDSSGNWPAAGGLEIVLLPGPDPGASAAFDPRECPASAAGLAYLIYTSGSTGQPKGVAQTHHNVLRNITAWARNLALGPADRLSLFSTYGYDAAAQDIFGALLSGASICPLDLRRLDRESLLDRIAGRGLTVLHATPTVYRYLFGGHVACRQDLSRVRLVVLGGEEARRADFELFKARFRAGTSLVNGYGLTEATAVLQWFGTHDSHPAGQSLPIGRPVAGQRVLLLDERGEPAAIRGEVVVESSTVAAGYWPLPVAEISSGPHRLHTGDLARYLPDGNLAFVGRRDDQLKIGGVRVEPGEIEAALREHPAISQAAIVAREAHPNETSLVAFVAFTAGDPLPTESDLRAHLRARLPALFVPAHILIGVALPRLPNGKVDRQRLRSLAAAEPDPGLAGLEDVPATGSLSVVPDHVTSTLVDIWRALLHRPAIGLDEDFFALGGHSLLATRLVARVRDRLRIELPLIQIFEAPTIRGLAARIVTLVARGQARPAPAIRALGREAGVPPESGQEPNPDSPGQR